MIYSFFFMKTSRTQLLNPGTVREKAEYKNNFDRLYTAVNQLRTNRNNTVWLNAGDFFQVKLLAIFGSKFFLISKSSINKFMDLSIKCTYI
jgi:hypothetical protein